MVEPGTFVEMQSVIDLITDVPAEKMLVYLYAALETWMRLRGPHDLAMWLHIALCTAIFGHCTHTCRELSIMLKMSTSKCAESRRFLLAKELVQRFEDEEGSGGRGRPRWKLAI